MKRTCYLYTYISQVFCVSIPGKWWREERWQLGRGCLQWGTAQFSSMASFVLPDKKEMNPSYSLVFVCAHPPQDPVSPRGSPAHSPRENGLDKRRLLKKDAPLSPSSIASSSSTPSSKSKEINLVSHLGNYSLLIFFFIVSLGSFLFLGIHKNVITERKV